MKTLHDHIYIVLVRFNENYTSLTFVALTVKPILLFIIHRPNTI
jgi:hypothetical protein